MTDVPRRDGAGDFRPVAWLANPHVQSILSSLPLRRPAVERRCRQLLAASVPEVIDCGEGVRLLAKRATPERLGRAPATRLAVLLHGWEGSADSLYVLSLGQHLLDRGFEFVRLNLRDHGESHHLNQEIFHSCRIAEVVGAVQRLQAMNPGQALSLVGFSLGGNIWLRVGARAGAARLRIEHIVAISPVLDPEHTLHRLELGWALYRRYFIRKWRRSLRKKQAAWTHVYDLSRALELESLTEMTEHLVCTYGGYASLTEYLHGYAIVGEALSSLAVPTRIIAAADDPIIPAVDLARLARPAKLEITFTALGGHCGYFEGGHGSTWLEREVLATLGCRPSG
jgi:predicted alpha/beta-fold hydrolase